MIDLRQSSPASVIKDMEWIKNQNGDYETPFCEKENQKNMSSGVSSNNSFLSSFFDSSDYLFIKQL